MTYDPYYGLSWASSGSWEGEAPAAGSFIDHISYSPEFDRTSGIYMGPGAARPAWPLRVDGETSVTLARPGRYLVDSADRRVEISGAPAFVDGVAEQFVSRYNDGDLMAYGDEAATARVIGLQIEQNTYSFSQPGPDNMVILHYNVINVSDDTLRDCYVGQVADPDIGNAANDRVRFYIERPELGSAVAWSENEPSSTPGLLLLTLLESPAVDSRGFIRHDRHDYDSSEQRGVGTLLNMSVDEAPRSQAERYSFLSANKIDGDNGPGDKQMLLATRSFNMLPGDTARFAVAFTVLADVTSYTGGVEPRIEAAAERAITLYRSGSTSTVPDRRSPAGSLTISGVHPNPARSRVLLDLQLQRSAVTSIRVTSALGQVVLTQAHGMMEAGSRTVGLDLSEIAPGMYIVTVESGGEIRSRALVVH